MPSLHQAVKVLASSSDLQDRTRYMGERHFRCYGTKYVYILQCFIYIIYAYILHLYILNRKYQIINTPQLCHIQSLSDDPGLIVLGPDVI